MTRSHWFLLLAASGLILVGVCTRTTGGPPTVSPGNEKKNDDQVPEPNLLKLPSYKEAMQMKLKASQSILEGIALNDFKKIQAAGEEIVMVSNVSDFLRAYTGKEYLFHVELLRRPAETIASKAKEKNIDGVMIAYNELTLSCLKCHQAMRGKKFTMLDRQDGTRDVRAD